MQTKLKKLIDRLKKTLNSIKMKLIVLKIRVPTIQLRLHYTYTQSSNYTYIIFIGNGTARKLYLLLKSSETVCSVFCSGITGESQCLINYFSKYTYLTKSSEKKFAQNNMARVGVVGP